jgi:hypothetical protein
VSFGALFLLEEFMSQDYQEAIRKHFYDLASDAPVHYGLSDVLADQPPHRLAAIKKAIGYTLSDHDLTRMSDMLTDPLFLEELLLFLPEDSIQAHLPDRPDLCHAG